jgi:hypothetical protein
MTTWHGHILADTLMEHRRRHVTSRRHRSALAGTIHRWLAPPRPRELKGPPVAGMLRAYRDLAERIASGLEQGAVRPEAVRAVEQLLSDACPRTDDLRRAVYLVESR